jgi:hypothetical protein
MPLMIDEISITVITPIITPRTVRKDLSLLARKVEIAILRFSKTSLRKIFISSPKNREP